MQNDKTTLRDLSIFTSDGSGDVFELINHTTTHAGRDMLRKHIQNPPDTFEKLQNVQDAVKFWSANAELWPKNVLNGTLVMLDKFFESADSLSTPPSGFTLALNSYFQRLLHKQEYFYTKFSLSHLADFLNGCKELVELAARPDVPMLLKRELETMASELKHRLTVPISAITKETKYADLMQLDYRARREMKHVVHRLIDSYSRLDAWRSMALAGKANDWVFPELLPALPVCMETAGLSHPLLKEPVSYDIAFEQDRNFLLLTGANMSGKTTFMRALGVGALLAHLGMSVPARAMRISFLQGIITNMQVEDSILRGESYFFAEVQRMKQTAEKLQKREPHLVLMDELFKGTNIHDAYECTRAVMDGLLHHPNHLMIISTHLYEVAQQFKTDNLRNKEILFYYFVTTMSAEGDYKFTYELKSGISDDRIGYRILQKEGVIDLLNRKS